MKTPRQIALLALTTAALSVYGADVATNWSDKCAKCHGEDGRGDTKMGKKLSIADLTDAKVQAQFTDEQAAKAMKSGVIDEKGKTKMKAIEGLSDDEMTALVSYVRALKK